MGYEIFDLLRKERGVSIAEVARATNIEKGMFTHWKRSRSKGKGAEFGKNPTPEKVDAK